MLSVLSKAAERGTRIRGRGNLARVTVLPKLLRPFPLPANTRRSAIPLPVFWATPQEVTRRVESTRLAHALAGRRCKEYPAACTTRSPHNGLHARASLHLGPDRLHRPFVLPLS